MPGQIDIAGANLYFKFTTRAFSTGIPTILVGGVISIYKDDSTTQSTTGVTLTANFDSVAGLNHVSIDTTADATFYANGHKYYLVITTGTVDSVSVVGEVVGEFELAAPVVTVGNTLAVDGSGRVDVGKALGQAVTLDSNNTLNVSAKYWAGTTIVATSIPVATAAGAAGGLFIAGPNAATTFASLTVTTTTTLTGAVSLGSTLGVTGTTTLAALTVSGATTLTGAVSLGSTLGITGTTTFTGSVTATAGITADITGNLSGTTGGMTAAGMALLFTANTTKVYADAVSGSVVKEIAANATATVSGTVDASIVSVNGNTFAGANVPCVLADGVAHGGTTAQFTMKSVIVSNPDGTACLIQSTATNGIGLWVIGSGGFASVAFGDGTSGATGLELWGGATTGNGLAVYSQVADAVFISSTDGDGIAIVPSISANPGARGLSIIGAGTGPAVQLGNGTNGAEALLALAGTGNTDAHGISVVGAGTGSGFDGTLSPSTLASYFLVDTTKVYADAVDGSVVKEIASNAGGGGSDPDVILSGVLGDQSLGDTTSIVLPSGPIANGVFMGSRLRMTSGACQYQERTIIVWNGTDKIATIDAGFFAGVATIGDSFEVFYDHSYHMDGAAGNVLSTVSGTVDANIVQIGGVAAGDDVEQTGVATTFFGRMRQFYNRFFPEGPSGEVVKNSGTHTIVTKDSTGTTTLTQNFTDDGHGNETIGPPS